jgi:uncharacterized protein
MKLLLEFGLRMYRRFISPMLPHSCRFVPTCSEYAIVAIDRHGVLRGSWLAVRRLLRCQPFARAGYDPVPHSGAACGPVWHRVAKRDFRPLGDEAKLGSVAAPSIATTHVGRYSKPVGVNRALLGDLDC